MADATRVPELVLFQWSKPGAPNPRLAAPISSTDTTITFTAAPKDKNGNIITGFFNFGIRNNAGYVENVHVPAGGMSVDGLTATGCIRGVGTSGYDYDTSVPGLADDHEQDSPVSCNVTAVLSALIEGALTGDIASTILFYLAASVPGYPDATARDAAITSPTNNMVVTTGGVLQYYSGGAWVDTGTGSATPNMSTTVAGKGQKSTVADAKAGTAIGVTGAANVITADVLQDSGVSTTTSAGAADAGKLVKLNASGLIDNSMISSTPIVRVYTDTAQTIGAASSQFDITNPSGTTFRYTWDGTGTNPNINPTTIPVGTVLVISSNNFSTNNNGVFTVTGVDTNYFEVTNPSGFAQNNVTIGSNAYIAFKQKVIATWTKPANLDYATIEVCGAGGGSGSNFGAGGGGGGYAKKTVAASSLGATETVTLGYGGGRGFGTTDPLEDGKEGGTTLFGSLISATGGQGGPGDSAAELAGGLGGIGVNGDFNCNGQRGGNGNATALISGVGGASFFGGAQYGGGATGGNSGNSGDFGGNGIIIVTEYY